MSCPKHIMASQIRELVRIASNKVIYQHTNQLHFIIAPSVNAPQVLSFFLSPMFSNPCYFFFFYPLPPFSQNGFSLASLI